MQKSSATYIIDSENILNLPKLYTTLNKICNIGIYTFTDANSACETRGHIRIEGTLALLYALNC